MNYVALTRIDDGKKLTMPGEAVSNPTQQMIDSLAVLPEDVFERITNRSEDLMDEGRTAQEAYAMAQSEIMGSYRRKMEREAEERRLEAGTAEVAANDSAFLPKSLSQREANTSKSSAKRKEAQKSAAKTKEPEDEDLATMNGPQTGSSEKGNKSENQTPKK